MPSFSLPAHGESGQAVDGNHSLPCSSNSPLWHRHWRDILVGADRVAAACILEKSAGLQTFSLTRIPKELLAGRRVMLEYLRQMKISAMLREGKETSDLVDKTLAHWLSMGPMEEQFKNQLAGTEFFSTLTSHMSSISDIDLVVEEKEEEEEEEEGCGGSVWTHP